MHVAKQWGDTMILRMLMCGIDGVSDITLRVTSSSSSDWVSVARKVAILRGEGGQACTTPLQTAMTTTYLVLLLPLLCVVPGGHAVETRMEQPQPQYAGHSRPSLCVPLMGCPPFLRRRGR